MKELVTHSISSYSPDRTECGMYAPVQNYNILVTSKMSDVTCKKCLKIMQQEKGK